MADVRAAALTDRLPDHVAHPLVRLVDVTRSYPNGTVALAGVSLTITEGEHVAIVGRSGSGKSTLLNVLGLLDLPTSGQVVVDGEHMEGADDRTRSERRASWLGFVFQRSHLIPGLSVRENVMLGLRYASGVTDVSEHVVREALVAVDLGSRSGAPARTLSGGEMQRVAIARTLVRPARLWLADEPTGNLDESQSHEIIHELKSRAVESGAALVVITHEPEIARQMDRVVTLRDGRVADDTAPPDVSGLAQAPRTALPRPVPAPTTLRTRAARTLRFAVQGVATSRGRTVAGVAAAAVAVALTVTALGLAQSASTQVTGLFDAQRASQVTAHVALDATAVRRWPLRVETVADFPGVTGVEHWQHHSGVPLANGRTGSLTVELVGVEDAPGAATSTEIVWAPSDDRRLQDDEILLGTTLAERLGLAQLDLQPEVVVSGRALRVVGLVTASRSGTARGSAFVTTTTATGTLPSLASTLHVTTAPGAARAVADRLPALADPFGATRISIDPVLEADAFRGELQSSVSASLTVLAVVASLAGLVGVVLVNLLSVASRTAELGVRRALGARRGELVALVVGECTALALLGAVVGLVLGFIAIMGATAIARWQPVFDPRLLVVPFLGAVVFGLVGGLPPAVAAGRVEPADAVRS